MTKKIQALQRRIRIAKKTKLTKAAALWLGQSDTAFRQSSLQRAFDEYHVTHPEVLAMIVKFARQIKARGYKTYGMASIIERLRWHYNIDKGTKFAIRDGFNSRYARLVMETCPDLRGFFRTSRLKA
jgi:hypothetical protein